MKIILRTILIPLAVSITSAIGPSNLAFGDSADSRAEFSIASKSKGRVVGGTSDGMSCRFKSDDGLIHCIYGHAKSTDWLATTVSAPQFTTIGNNRIGQFQPEVSKSYAYLNTETSTNDGGGGIEHCKLALQFLTTANEIIWIWHDELRFDGSSQYAAIDTNGDNIADKAISGIWNGNLGGSNRWTSANSNENRYSDDERKFAARPIFGKINGLGRRRGCNAAGVEVAEIQRAVGLIGTSADGAGAGLEN